MAKIKEIMSLTKLTDLKWLNVFSMKFKNKLNKDAEWFFVSRKKSPQCVDESVCPDGISIVPFIKTKDGIRIVLIKEYRAPINDYEYGFPAGLIEGDYFHNIAKELKEETGLDVVDIQYLSNPIYSSAGLSDESVIIAFVTAKGEITKEFQEENEDIEVVVADIEYLKSLLLSGKCIGAKSWGVIYHFAEMGKFPDYNIED